MKAYKRENSILPAEEIFTDLVIFSLTVISVKIKKWRNNNLYIIFVNGDYFMFQHVILTNDQNFWFTWHACMHWTALQDTNDFETQAHGYKSRRPGLKTALRTAHAGDCTLISWKLDRQDYHKPQHVGCKKNICCSVFPTINFGSMNEHFKPIINFTSLNWLNKPLSQADSRYSFSLWTKGFWILSACESPTSFTLVLCNLPTSVYLFTDARQVPIVPSHAPPTAQVQHFQSSFFFILPRSCSHMKNLPLLLCQHTDIDILTYMDNR